MRWQRRDEKLRARKHRIKQSGASIKRTIVPAIDRRASALKRQAPRRPPG